MAYVVPSDGEPISHETLLTVARLVGIPIPDEDLEPLSTAVRDQLASIETLDVLDLTDVGPILTFDPRWHD